jgi:PAS domain S-box-containing protein
MKNKSISKSQSKTQIALQESEARYRTLVENIPQRIFMKDRNYKWVSINENFASDLGILSKDIVGKVDRDLFPRDIADKYHADDMRILETGNTEEFEEESILNGRHAWVNTIKAPVRDEKGGIVGVFGIFWDITRSKLAEEEIRKLNAELEERVSIRTAQLEVSNRELDAFTYSVSHDLRAPLRAIDGFSKLVLEDYENKLDSEGKRLLNLIRSNTQKMGKLITDLLALSRITRCELYSSGIDMTKMAISMFKESAATDVLDKISFIVDPLPEAYTDPTYMKQVWTNLIGNAIKFSSKEKKPLIKICGHTENGFNVYYVKDNGVGFNPDYTHKLFGVFQRLHRSDDFEGTGVGLAIIQRIIHRQGGKVWAIGEEGKGATFYFSVPVYK